MSRVLLAAIVALASAGLGAAADEAVPAAAAAGPTDGVVAYYFHGTMRCATCRQLEAFAEEAITEGFPDELASGRLAWRAVNTDQPENAHFVDDFQLTAKAVVLVSYQDGKVARFENLTRVWQLVRDRDAFLAYVRDATLAFMSQG